MTGRFWRALARSPKATAGAILLAALLMVVTKSPPPVPIGHLPACTGQWKFLSRMGR